MKDGNNGDLLNPPHIFSDEIPSSQFSCQRSCIHIQPDELSEFLNGDKFTDDSLKERLPKVRFEEEVEYS